MQSPFLYLHTRKQTK